MNRNLIIGAGIVILLGLVFFAGIPNLAITAYDGIEATVSRVEQPYGDQDAHISGLDSGSCTFDPSTSIEPGTDVNGVHISFQQPNILDYEELAEISESEIIEDQNGDLFNHTKIWVVQRVRLEMFVHLWTTGYGFNAMENSKFWIQLQENGYSVFMNPDESEAFILNVYTTQQTQITGGSFSTVSPMGEGIDVEINTVRTENVPSWIIDSGYTGALSEFKTIEFPVEIVKVQRHSIAYQIISECDIQMWFGIDVLLFGYWEETKPYRKGAYDVPDLLGQLLQVLFTMSGIIVVSVAMISTVIVLIRIQHPWVRAFAIIAIWVAVFIVFLMIGVTVIL